jgi:hypothetical protein
VVQQPQPTGFSTGQKIVIAIGLLLVILLALSTVWLSYEIATGGPRSAISQLIPIPKK